MQSLPQGIQQFNLCSRQALPTSMYPWSTKDISFPEFNMDYSTQFQGNLFYEQQKRIKFLEDELKRHKSQIEDLSSKLIIFEQEKAKEQKKKIQSRYWTPEEHERFLEALEKYGCKDVKAISNFVGTRSATQVRTHAQKYFLRLEREKTRDGDESPDGSETKPKTGKKKRSHAETKSEKNRKCNDGFSSSNEESSEESTTSPESIPKSNEEVDTKPIVRSNEEISAPLTTTVPEKELPKTGDKEPPTMLSEEDTADSGDNKRMRRNTSQNFGNAYQIPFFCSGTAPTKSGRFQHLHFWKFGPESDSAS